MNKKLLKNILLSMTLCSVMVIGENGYTMNNLQQQNIRIINYKSSNYTTCQNVRKYNGQVHINLHDVKSNGFDTGTYTSYNDNWVDIDTIIQQLKQPKNNQPIGAENVGATCYMNVTLQSFANRTDWLIDMLKQLKNQYDDNLSITVTSAMYNNATETNNKKQLVMELIATLVNLRINKYGKRKNFAPIEFKQILSKSNSVFEGIQANDSKDLVNYIIMTCHEVLNTKNNSSTATDINLDQSDPFAMYSTFCQEFDDKNDSPLSQYFYAKECQVTQCQNPNCLIKSSNIFLYNYQTYFFKVFPLEEVRKFKQNLQANTQNNLFMQNNMFMNTGQNNTITLQDCFAYDKKVNYMTGQNAMYCNYCRQTCDSSHVTNLVTTPETLILLFNRGVGIQFNLPVKIDEYLNLQDYIMPVHQMGQNTNYNYKLSSIIVHMGESGSGGHFVCYTNRGGTWYLCNDGMVTKRTSSEMSELLNNSQQHPYLLFYDKLHNNSNNNVSNNIINNNLPNNPMPVNTSNTPNNQFNMNNNYGNNTPMMNKNLNFNNNFINNTPNNNMGFNTPNNNYNNNMINYNNNNIINQNNSNWNQINNNQPIFNNNMQMNSNQFYQNNAMNNNFNNNMQMNMNNNVNQNVINNNMNMPNKLQNIQFNQRLIQGNNQNMQSNNLNIINNSQNADINMDIPTLKKFINTNNQKLKPMTQEESMMFSSVLDLQDNENFDDQYRVDIKYYTKQLLIDTINLINTWNYNKNIAVYKTFTEVWTNVLKYLNKNKNGNEYLISLYTQVVNIVQNLLWKYNIRPEIPDSGNINIINNNLNNVPNNKPINSIIENNNIDYNNNMAPPPVPTLNTNNRNKHAEIKSAIKNNIQIKTHSVNNNKDKNINKHTINNNKSNNNININVKSSSNNLLNTNNINKEINNITKGMNEMKIEDKKNDITVKDINISMKYDPLYNYIIAHHPNRNKTANYKEYKMVCKLIDDNLQLPTLTPNNIQIIKEYCNELLRNTITFVCNYLIKYNPDCVASFIKAWQIIASYFNDNKKFIEQNDSFADLYTDVEYILHVVLPAINIGNESDYDLPPIHS